MDGTVPDQTGYWYQVEQVTESHNTGQDTRTERYRIPVRVEQGQPIENIEVPGQVGGLPTRWDEKSRNVRAAQAAAQAAQDRPGTDRVGRTAKTGDSGQI